MNWLDWFHCNLFWYNFPYVATSTSTAAKQGSYIQTTVLQFLIAVPNVVVQVPRCVIKYGRHVTLASFYWFDTEQSLACQVVHIERGIDLAV